MYRNNTKAKILLFKINRKKDHVPETSETPAASEPLSVYKNPALAVLEENNLEQPIEWHTSQRNEERQSISNKRNQARNIIFPWRHFGKQKRAFNLKWSDQFKFLHQWEDSYSVICHTCAVAKEQQLLHLDTKREDIYYNWFC